MAKENNIKMKRKPTVWENILTNNFKINNLLQLNICVCVYIYTYT